jgi:hypothetical protein
MGHHHVRSHHWVNGLLSTVDAFFETLEEAIEHAEVTGAHTTKVYNAEGELLHVKTPDATETYA